MKTIPTIAMTFALALSLPACTTTTSSASAMKSSVMVGNPAVVLRHPYHQAERKALPKSIPVTANPEAPATESVDEGVGVRANDPSAQSSMKHTVVSILGQIVVACATSGKLLVTLRLTS